MSFNDFPSVSWHLFDLQSLRFSAVFGSWRASWSWQALCLCLLDQRFDHHSCCRLHHSWLLHPTLERQSLPNFQERALHENPLLYHRSCSLLLRAIHWNRLPILLPRKRFDWKFWGSRSHRPKWNHSLFQMANCHNYVQQVRSQSVCLNDHLRVTHAHFGHALVH